MSELFPEDFDLTVQDVILAHIYTYTANTVSNLYARGRKTSGVVYCISGCADYIYENSTFRLNSGEMVFLAEGIAYTVSCPEEFQHITVNFQLLSSAFENRLAHMVVKDVLQAEDILRRIIQLWGDKKAGFRVQVKSLLYELLFQYFTGMRKQYRTVEYGKLRPAKRILDIHYDLDIPISQLAAACGFSETHFRRLFQKEFHCSPLEYRLEKRFMKAKDLLLAGELSVSQISSKVGFSDVNYFSRMFKQRFGVSPTIYVRG